MMNQIGRHIEFLVRCNDCVIIPGLGAFISQHQSALLRKNGLLLPPSRVLGFNPSLTHDDGLLASSIVRRNKVSYDVAMKQIAREVDAMRHQLNVHGEIAISNIGLFRKNDEGKMVFEPFLKSSAMFGYLNLPQVNIRPIKSSNDNQNAVEQRREDTIYLPIRRSWTRVAASIVIVLGLGFVLSTPIVKDDSYQASLSTPAISAPQKAEIKPNEPKCAEQIVFDVASSSVVEQNNEITLEQENVSISKKEAKSQVTSENSQEKCKPINENIDSKSENSLRISETDNYCLVVASLENREQAEKYISNSKNNQLSILEKNGYCRVYAATGATSKDVLSSARKAGLMQKYPNAWVCRK